MAKKEISEETIKSMYAACIENKNDLGALDRIKKSIIKRIEVPNAFNSGMQDNFFGSADEKNEIPKKKLTSLDIEAFNIASALELQVKYGNNNNPDIKDIVNGVFPALQSNDFEKLLDLDKKLSDFRKNNPNHEFTLDSCVKDKFDLKNPLSEYRISDHIQNKILVHPDLIKEKSIEEVLEIGEKLEKFAERLNKSGAKKMTIKFDDLSKGIKDKIKSFDSSKASKQEITEFMIAVQDAKPFLEKKGVDVERQMYDMELLRGKGLENPAIFEKHSATDIAKLIESESKKIGTNNQNDKKLNGKEACRAVLSSIPHESWGKMHEVAKILDKRKASRGNIIGRTVQNFTDAIASFVSAVKSIGNSTKNKELKDLSNSFNASLQESKSKHKSKIDTKILDQTKEVVRKMKNSGVNKVVTDRQTLKNNKDINSGIGR
jgi:NADPH-dependent 7-cyano-7-deazaguanine reductase QueF-like protein